jgi:spore germination protein GerM
MKRRRRKKRKSSVKGVLITLVLIGVVIGLATVYHDEISRFAKPWIAKRGFPERKKMVTLYFSDPEAEYLAGEKREIRNGEEVEEEAQEAVRELIRGPKGRLLPTLPSGTELLSFELDDKGVAKVNFSRAFSRNHPGGSSAEMMTVYSVVNTLTLNFPAVKNVQFLVEGAEIDSIAGHLSLGQPVASKPDLIKNNRKN